MRTCNHCKNTKPLTEFWKSKGRKDGYQTFCIKCQKEWASKNRESINLGKRSRRKTCEGRYRGYLEKAKERHFIFKLSLDEFQKLTCAPCSYCNGFSKGKDYCGIDRTDNKEGYILSNCTSCCELCNKMKRTLSVTEFKEQIVRIYKKLNEQ